jgi:hypothetical protein
MPLRLGDRSGAERRQFPRLKQQRSDHPRDVLAHDPVRLRGIPPDPPKFRGHSAVAVVVCWTEKYHAPDGDLFLCPLDRRTALATRTTIPVL